MLDFELTLFTTQKGDTSKTSIVYKLCTYGDCALTEAEQRGETSTVEVITTSVNSEQYGDLYVSDKQTKITYKGQLDHRS